jgi:predicted transcriptional regulator YdeE
MSLDASNRTAAFKAEELVITSFKLDAEMPIAYKRTSITPTLGEEWRQFHDAHPSLREMKNPQFGIVFVKSMEYHISVQVLPQDSTDQWAGLEVGNIETGWYCKVVLKGPIPESVQLLPKTYGFLHTNVEADPKRPSVESYPDMNTIECWIPVTEEGAKKYQVEQ